MTQRWKDMCDLVRSLDSAAADWLEAKDGPHPTWYVRDYWDGGVNAFNWNESPQGYTFWSTLNINLKLRFPHKYPVPKTHSNYVEYQQPEIDIEEYLSVGSNQW